MKHRNMPDWPTRMAQIAATITFVGGPLAFRYAPVMREWNINFWPSVAISSITALVVGFLVLRFCEWLFDTHMDSIETKSRSNVGIMYLTAGILVFAIATFVMQWQKTAG